MCRIGVLVLTVLMSSSICAGTAQGFVQFKTVTFYENSHVGDLVSATETNNVATPLTAFAALNPPFSNPGYTFTGWNSKPDGTGTTYVNLQTYSFTAAISLYAIWQRQYHTVIFHENGFVGDSTSCTQSANTTTALTLELNLCASFTNSGYRFSNWNTSSDGTGTSFSDGAQFSFESNLDLYASWNLIPAYTISFNSNGATQTVPSITNLSGSTITIPGASSLSKSGYIFSGWSSTQDGGGAVILPGAQYLLLGDGSFWAVWTPEIYSVEYLDSKGATLSANTSYQVGSTPLTLPFPTRPGYTFLGWFDSSVSGSQVGIGGGSFTPSTNCVLYGRWQVNTYTVTLDPNGGSVYRQTFNFVYGSPAIQLPIANKAGYIFDGWYQASNLSILVGSGGAYIYPDATETLAAKWTPNPSFSISYEANGGTTSAIPIVVSSGDSFRLPTISTTSNTEKVLIGWSTDATATVPSFAPDQVVTPATSTRYFAIWGDSVPWQIFGTIGIFARQKSTLTSLMKHSVKVFARYLRLHRAKSVEILGYASFTGHGTVDSALSTSRAHEVAKYLKAELNRMKISGVSVIQLGEGSLPGNTGVLFATVEMLIS